LYGYGHPLALPSLPTRRSSDLWLADISCDEGPYLIYARHWQRYFGKVGNLTRGKIAEYWRHRLGVVLRRTAVKERGPLEDFLDRSEEHTSELQSREKLVCRLLL